MKVKLYCIHTLLCILFFNVVNAQNINIPNYDFATNLNGWSVTGNNITLTDSGVDYTGGVLYIVNPTFNEETFVLTSSSFPLFANDNYVFFTEYGYYLFDPMFGVNQFGQLSNVVLKNSSGTVVQTFNLNCTVFGNGLDFCDSSPFLIDTTDSYYLELTGTIGHTDPNSYTEANYIFSTINLYKDNSPHVIQGKVTYDENADNCVTSTYTPTNIQIKSTAATSGNVYYSNTNSLGNYGFSFEETGTVITEIPNGVITSNPINYSNTFTTAQTISNQDFCITSTIVGTDVSVVIIPTTDARPGFDSGYSIVYTNNGGTTATGTIDFTYDTTLVNHLSSSPTENSATANSLSWNYSNLQPFETRVINVFFNINTPPIVNNGDVLSFQASISPIAETVTINNTFDLQQITIGSYDPNDAIVLQGSLITAAQASEDLHFRIRFQNTGTASAININVNTILDVDLDWTTFTPLYASHAYTTTVNNGEVNFKFDNINLADSTSDEPNSHGYIVFKAKPNVGFAVGDIVSCKADIYFDYNLPIITNTATTQINPTLSLGNVVNSEASFTMYPNPVKNQLEVVIQKEATYVLLNSRGQQLQKGVLYQGKNTLNLESISNGIYFLKVVSANSFSTKKIIKQ
ncbi:T9SS type A sorting domain-containing protein [uncultured Kordia sp.]|uniref:T9SS type A sorting domain-containing protein n=1 Tax=uncultured Kordia sp. TaxID=507699 RepID=UPI00260AC075|nr:T9SS type A sorting domain-containing protein [uncultured Kordia sp.]